MMSWPASPRTRMRPIGPAIADAERRALPRASSPAADRRDPARCPSRVCNDQHAGARATPPAGARFGSIVRRKLRDVIAEHFAESAGLEEIALHVDDQQRRSAREPTRKDRARLRCPSFPLPSFVCGKPYARHHYVCNLGNVYAYIVILYAEIGCYGCARNRRKRAGRAREARQIRHIDAGRAPGRFDRRRRPVGRVSARIPS